MRIYHLHTIPPGLFFDEAANLFDIDSVLKGARPLYFPANNGREPLFFYWASLFAARWGLNSYAIRLASAVVGTLTLLATYFCAREMALTWKLDRRWAAWTGVAATFLLAVTYLHLHYSRIGLRTIMLPLFLALSFGCLFRGIRQGSPGWFALAGLFGGVSIYTYISSRVAPALLALPPLVLLPAGRFRWALERGVLAALVWAIVCVPLGAYTLRHAAEIQGHTDDVSILNPVNSHGNPVGAVERGVVATLASFNVVGTDAAEQNLPYRPILSVVQSVFFFAGLAALGIGALRPKLRGLATEKLPKDGPGVDLGPLVALFLVGWILDQATPSALAVNPPGFIRMTGTLPALSIVGGIGVVTACERLAHWLRSPAIARGIVGVALTAAAVGTARDYFLVWAPSPEAYHLMMADKVDAATYLDQAAKNNRVFLAPLYATDNTVKFLTREVSIESFDVNTGLVVPTDRSRDVEYDFPASDAQEASLIQSELPVAPTVQTILDPANGSPLLTRLWLGRASLPEQPDVAARFGDTIGLTRASIAPASVAPGGSVVITIVWLALAPSPDDYTVFIHARDAANATVGQADGQPAAGTVPTTAWKPGDLLWDRHTISLPPTAKAGPYRVVVGLYRHADLKRLPAQLSTGRADSDEVEIGKFSVTSP